LAAIYDNSTPMEGVVSFGFNASCFDYDYYES